MARVSFLILLAGTCAFARPTPDRHGWFAGKSLQFDARSNSRAWRNPLSGCSVHWLLAQKIDRSDVVVILRRSAQDDDRSDLAGVAATVVDILKDVTPPALRTGDAVRLDRRMAERRESYYLAFALAEGSSLGVITIEPLTEEAYALVKALTARPIEFRKRLRLLINAARSKDEWSRNEALAEFNGIPFSRLRGQADVIPAETVREWAFSTQFHEERSVAMPLLALAGNDQDRERVGRRLFENGDLKQSQMQPLHFAWIWMSRPEGLGQYLSRFLLRKVVHPDDGPVNSDLDVTYVEAYSAYFALAEALRYDQSGRFHEVWDRVSRHLVKQPVFTDIVFRQNWMRGDWRLLSHATEIARSGSEEYARQAALVYLMLIQRHTDDKDVRKTVGEFLADFKKKRPEDFQQANRQLQFAQSEVKRELTGDIDRKVSIQSLLLQAEMILSTPVIRDVPITEFMAPRSDAIAYCTQALKLDRKNVRALRLRAQAFEEDGQPDKAERDRSFVDFLLKSKDEQRRILQDFDTRLRSDKVVVRWRAVADIIESGLFDAALVPALVELLDREKPPRRSQTIQALGLIGPDAAAATDSLLRIVQADTTIAERRVAAESLGLIGARSAVPALTACLDSPVAIKLAIKLAAAEALWRINQSPEAIATLVELVGKGAPCRMDSADDVLLWMATESEAPARALEEHIQTHDSSETKEHRALLKRLR